MISLVENIRRVARVFDVSVPRTELSRNLSVDLAEALRWTTGIASAQPIQIDSVPLQATRGMVGPQPAAVFVAGGQRSTIQLLNDAAFYAYHASIPWGIIAAIDGALVFNSHWIREDNWFHLPPIQWDELDRNLDILEAITPEGVAYGHIERLATEVYKPDRFLLPVDDMLVERLDYWRAQTLRYSKNITDVDQQLQTLFAQFFVLRAVEDRGLAPSLAILNSICTSTGRADLPALRKLLKQAQQVIGSELFDIDALEHVPEMVLCGIIRDLYFPHALPHNALRYNFSWIDADVLGLAYEKYLSTILSPVAPSPQLSLFEQPVREVERVSVRKTSGAYYTPNYLVQYLSERCLDHLETTMKDDQLPRIADFACGSGSFLVGVADALIRRLRERDPDRNWARDLVNGKHIVGVDIDERAVIMARLSLWLRFTEEPHPLPLPRLENIIVHGDSLSREIWELIPSTYDGILGNPPFLATGRTTSREDLSVRFRSAQGRYDYSYLFVELAVDRLNPGGILAMIVPNRLFRNRDASVIREILATSTDIDVIVDFGSSEVFEGISAYIGSIIAEKDNPKVANRSASTRVIHVNEVSTAFLGSMLTDATVRQEEVRTEYILAYNAPLPRGGSPWLLLSQSARRARNLLENQSELLGEVVGIYQGIRTGANDIFIVEIESSGDGLLARVVNGLGDSSILETAMLRPAAFGSDIQRYDFVAANRRLVYPYSNNAAIPEKELREKYPRTYEYLLVYRDLLASRVSVSASGQHWYELVRRRDESWLESPKLLMRDLAPQTSFAIDQGGTIFLIGGTAIVPPESQMLLPLLGYLNSRLVNLYLRQITPSFKGGFQKFEPQHLHRVPVLRPVIDDDEVTRILSDTVLLVLHAKMEGAISEQRSYEDKIDQILWDLSGISEQDML